MIEVLEYLTNKAVQFTASGDMMMWCSSERFGVRVSDLYFVKKKRVISTLERTLRTAWVPSEPWFFEQMVNDRSHTFAWPRVVFDKFQELEMMSRHVTQVHESADFDLRDLFDRN